MQGELISCITPASPDSARDPQRSSEDLGSGVGEQRPLKTDRSKAFEALLASQPRVSASSCRSHSSLFWVALESHLHAASCSFATLLPPTSPFVNSSRRRLLNSDRWDSIYTYTSHDSRTHNRRATRPYPRGSNTLSFSSFHAPTKCRTSDSWRVTCDALRSSNAKLELTAKPLFRRVVAALYHAVRRGYRRNGQPVPGRILHPHRCRSSSAEKALKGWSGWVSKSALERSDCGDAPLSHVTAHTRVFHNMRCTPIVERQTGTHGETSFSSCGSSAVSRRSARIQT